MLLLLFFYPVYLAAMLVFWVVYLPIWLTLKFFAVVFHLSAAPFRAPRVRAYRSFR